MIFYMGRKGGYKFGAQLDRNYRAGAKIADNITKGFLLGGLFGVDYIYRKSKQYQSVYAPLTPEEERKVRMLELQYAKPFSFRKVLSLHIVSYLFAIASPLIGTLLYCAEDWWMFFCVLLFGVAEICFLLPSGLLSDNIKIEWKFNSSDKRRQVTHLKILLWLSIIVNVILVTLNSYPFVVVYDEGVLVVLMTLFLYLVNVWSIVLNIQSLKNINKLFDENIERFTRSTVAESVQVAEVCQEESNVDSRKDQNEESAKIHKYLNRCHEEDMPLIVINANIRIANAMIDACKNGNYKLSYSVVTWQLEQKIQQAKREFVKRECRIAIEILLQLKCSEVDELIKDVKNKYITEQ